jgi:acetylglutamate kinase
MKTIVVKIGGNAVKKSAKEFIAFVRRALKTSKVIVVHGGGPEVNAWLAKMGLKPKFVNGVRCTDVAALEAVVMILAGKINKELVSLMTSSRVKAAGFSAADGGTAVCRRVKKLGLVGEPVKINTALVSATASAGFVPVVSSLGADASGRLLNINADVLADALAAKLKSSRLVYVTDVAGVIGAGGKVIDRITPSSASELIKKGIITGGMIPKIRSAFKSIKNGVGEVVITDLKSKGTALSAK